MLTIEFASISSPVNHTTGAGAALEFIGPELFLGDAPVPAARHEHHQWRVQRDFYTAIHVSGWLCVRFEDELAAHGPFAGLRVIGGVMQADDGHVLAIYSETDAVWELTDEERGCARVTVEDAEAAADTDAVAAAEHPAFGGPVEEIVALYRAAVLPADAGARHLLALARGLERPTPAWWAVAALLARRRRLADELLLTIARRLDDRKKRVRLYLVLSHHLDQARALWDELAAALDARLPEGVMVGGENCGRGKGDSLRRGPGLADLNR